MVEVEAVLNCRPVTYIYEEDVEVPLTPSQLFCGRRVLDREELSSDKLDEETDLCREELVQRVNREESAVNHFWKRWYKEYLVDLREHHKLHKPKDGERIEIGDVVLVEEENAKRNSWKLGRVNEVIKGRDGIIRGAEVITSKKGFRGKISRPLQKLYPIEVRN